MNFALVSLSTELSKGLSALRKSLAGFSSVEIRKISGVYRRIEESTDQTLAAEILVVVSIAVPWNLPETQEFVRRLWIRGMGTRSLLLSFNHEVHLDPHAPIPHPDLHLDPLILHCAAEIQGGFEHPVLGRSLQELVKSTQSSGQAQFEFLTRGESLLSDSQEAP